MINLDGLINYCHCCVMPMLHMRGFQERIDSTYVMKHFKTCIPVVSKSFKEILKNIEVVIKKDSRHSFLVKL